MNAIIFDQPTGSLFQAFSHLLVLGVYSIHWSCTLRITQFVSNMMHIRIMPYPLSIPALTCWLTIWKRITQPMYQSTTGHHIWHFTHLLFPLSLCIVTQCLNTTQVQHPLGVLFPIRTWPTWLICPSSTGTAPHPDNRLLDPLRDHPVMLHKIPSNHGHHNSYTLQICKFSSSLLVFTQLICHICTFFIAFLFKNWFFLAFYTILSFKSQ